MSRTVGFVDAASAIAVAAACGSDAVNEAFLDETTGKDAVYEPLPEIVDDPVTTENVAEPVADEAAAEQEKPKRGRKKAEVSDESDSDG